MTTNKEKLFRDIREELEQRTRERINRGNRQGTDGRIEAEVIHSNAERSEHNRESFKGEILDRNDIGSDSGRNHSGNRDNDLLHVEQLSRDKGFKSGNSDLAEGKSELRGVKGFGEVRIDRDNQAKGWRNIYRKSEQESDNLQSRGKSSGSENSEIKKGFIMNYQEELKTLFNELQTEAEKQKSALQKEIESLTNINMDLMRENKKLMSTVESQAKSIEILTNENEELMKIINSLKISIEALQNQNEKLKELLR